MSDRDQNGKFIKGNPGGPGRPPKALCISDLTAELLAKESPEFARDKSGRKTKKHITYLQAFVVSQVTRAINGDAAAARNVWERIEGKVPQALEHGNEDGQPFIIQIGKEFEGV